MKSRGFKWMLAVASGALALGALGIGLEFLDQPPPTRVGWRASHRISRLELNQLGFRGQPIAYNATDTVVVLLGDSQVEAMACAYTWMPERRLEHHLREHGLRARVFSVAAAGYGQDQQLLALRDYFARGYRADVVLLWQTPTNDIWNNLFPTHWPTNGAPKPTFWLAEAGQLAGPTAQLGEAPDARVPAILRLLRRALGSRDPDGEWERRLPPSYVPQSRSEGPVEQAWQERWDANTGGMRDENLASEKSHLALWLTPRSPRMQYGIDLTRRLLDEISTLAVSHGARFEIFRADTPEQVEDRARGAFALNGRYYRTSGEQRLANLDDLSRGFATHVLPVTIDHPFVGPEDAHLNEHAVEQLMRELAGRIAPALAAAH